MSSFISTTNPLPAMELDFEYLSSLVSCLCTRRRVTTKDAKRRQVKELEQHFKCVLFTMENRILVMTKLVKDLKLINMATMRSMSLLAICSELVPIQGELLELKSESRRVEEHMQRLVVEHDAYLALYVPIFGKAQQGGDLYEMVMEVVKGPPAYAA